MAAPRKNDLSGPPRSGRPCAPDRSASEPTINELSQPDPAAGPSAGLEHHPPEDRAQLLGSIVDHLADPLLVCVQDGQDPVIRISFVNQALCDLMGYDHADLVGRSPGLLVGPDTDLDTLRRVESRPAR